MTYAKNGTTYASGSNIANENWDCSSYMFPYETVITVSNISPATGYGLSKVVIGGQTISGSNGTYTYTMTSNANVEIYTYNIPTTITASSTTVSPGSTAHTILYLPLNLGGGGGKWTLQCTNLTIKADRYDFESIRYDSDFGGQSNIKSSVSDVWFQTQRSSSSSSTVTGETTASTIYLVHPLGGVFYRDSDGDKDYLRMYYTYTIRATSVYNGTYADVTVTVTYLYDNKN